VQQRLSEEVRNMVLVSEVGQSFARQQGESGLLEAMTRSARILFNFDSAVVLLENPTGQALVGTPGGVDQQRVSEFSIPLAKGGVVAEAALERRLAFVDRHTAGLGLAEEQLLRMLGSDTMVCVPLVAGARCLGVMLGGVAAWQMSATLRRERFMQAFGVQAANALETAISERGHARRQLAHVAEEYREGARRVVHEVNNPLSIIKNYLSVLDNKLARQEPVIGEMSILNEEIDRVGQLISGLADLQPTPTVRATDVAKVADDVLRLFSATDFVPAKVEVALEMGEHPTEVDGDADILKQILVNLVKNAVEALCDLPEGGRIAIANRGIVNRDRKLYLELAVTDTGPGMPQEVLAHLFSPVRSSKPGAHHGLGLSIVHSLVRKLGGLVSCRSSRTGTSFEILLPVRSTPTVAGSQPRALDSV